jgi:glycosidase
MGLHSRLARRLIAISALLVSLTVGVAAAAPERKSTQATPVWKHDWSKGAVFYEVFVRSFADSDGDGIGDLNGLTARLDYLAKDLGVNALWLMPVFVSPSYHGYDTTDYEHINPAYGTDEDFERFLKEAHARGLKVIVDFVVNHTGSTHPWFLDSASSPTSAKRDWYLWRKDDPGWTQPWGGGPTWHARDGAYYYGVFWSGMPDLNHRNPAVRAEIKRIATLWLNRGVDGFRVDAARHIVENGAAQQQVDQPETHAFWREFAAHVRSVKPEATVVGENWTETPIIATYFGSTARLSGGDELTMNFNFPLGGAILEAVKGASAAPLAQKLQEIQRIYPKGVADAPFLTNHDMPRLASLLEGHAGRLRNAAAILLTLPGAPFLYYGEEVGLENGGKDSDDRLKRTPMPWDASEGGGFSSAKPWFPFAPGREKANVAAQLMDPGSLLSRYRTLIRLRKAAPALATGSLKLLDAQPAVLAYVRQKGAESLLVVHNLSDAAVETDPLQVPGAVGKLLFGDGASQARGGKGAWRVKLPARGSAVWRIQ